MSEIWFEKIPREIGTVDFPSPDRRPVQRYQDMCPCLDIVIRPESVDFAEEVWLTVVFDDDSGQRVPCADFVHIHQSILALVCLSTYGCVCI